MSESGLVRRVNAGSYLYMKPISRSGLNRILAKSEADVQMTITVEATEQVEHFKKARYWTPVTIDATNDKIDYVAVLAGPTLTAYLPHGVYDSPLNLANALFQAMDAADVATGNKEYFVDWDEESFKFTIRHIEETTGEPDFLSILWKTGPNGADNGNTSCAAVFGFDDAADDTGASSYESDNATGAPVTWASLTSIVVNAKAQKLYEVPAGGLLRLKASVGQAELRFHGDPGFEDPPYSQGPQR